MIAAPDAAIGVAYFLWRRTRWTLVALAANLLLLAILARALPEKLVPVFVIAPGLMLLVWGTQLLGAFTFGPTDFGARASGFPAYMLGLPARTAALVGWPMLYSAATILIGFVALRLAIHPDFDVLVGAGYCVALFAWFQVAAWFPFPIPIVRGIVAVGAAFGLVLVGGLTLLVGYSYNVVAGFYLASTLTAFGVAWYGVHLTRRGEGQESFVLPRLARLIPARRIPQSAIFRSAAAAQLWYECRRNMIYLPALMTIFGAVVAYGLSQPDLGGEFISESISKHELLVLVLFAAPIVFGQMLAGGLGKFEFWSNKAPTFTAFFSTRPMPTTEFVLVKLRAAARSTLITWLIVQIALGCGMLWGKWQRPGEPVFANIRLDTLRPWLIAAAAVPVLMFMTWRSIAIGLYMPLCGRPWVTNTLSFLSFVPILAAGPVWLWWDRHPAHRDIVVGAIPWLAVSAAAIKVIVFVCVCNTLGRRGLLSPNGANGLACGWLGLANILMLFASALTGFAPLAAPAMILLLPGVRVALGPLALQWNRHRSGRTGGQPFLPALFELWSARRYLEVSAVHVRVPVKAANEPVQQVITLKTTLIVVVTLVVVGALAGGGAWLRGRSAAEADQNVKAVRVEPVERGELVELVQAPGEIQPRNKVSISAKISSRIVEIPPKEGDQIKQGNVLVKLDASDLEAVLRSAQARYAAQESSIGVAQSRVAAQRAQIEGLKASLKEAELDLERQKGLITSHDVSQSVVDTAERRVQEQNASLLSAEHNLKAEETNLQVLRHNLDAADAEIARAKEDLSYTIIESPIDGVVTVLNAKVGELVMTGTMNNAGTVIMEVADLSQMLVVARVDETDVANVEVGQHARVHVQAYPNRTFNGTVTAVALARSVERNNNNFMSGDAKTFKVEILLDTQGQRIYSGLTADVEIEAHRHAAVLKVPSQAVLGRATDDLPQAIRDGNANVDKIKTLTTVVYRIVDGKAIVTPVKVGPSDVSNTLIESGLNDGDRVITGPYKILESLANDQKVKEEAKPATTQPTTAPAIAKL